MLASQGKDAVERKFKTVPGGKKKLKGRRWKLLDLKFEKFSSTLEGDGSSAGCYEHYFHNKASGHLCNRLHLLSLLRLHVPPKKAHSEFLSTNSTEAVMAIPSQSPLHFLFSPSQVQTSQVRADYL